MPGRAPRDTRHTTPNPPTVDDLESAYGYERLSQDREGEKRKVKEQRADIDEAGPLLGYNVVRHFDDPSVSASKYDINRPGFDALCEALKTSGVRNVLVTEVTRISRQDESGGAFMGTMIRIGGKVIKVPEGTTYDFSNTEERNKFRQDLHDAIRESEKISARVLRSHVRKREEKQWTGGPRPYGWHVERYAVIVDGRAKTRSRWHIEDSEAEVIREMFAAIIRGESRNTIAMRLNQREVKPPRGSFWSDASITSIVTNPRACGLYGLKVDGNWQIPEVQPEVQEFPPIVDYSTWDAVQTLLGNQAKNPLRISPHDGVNVTAGLFRCAACLQALDHHNQKNYKPSLRHTAKGRARPCPADHKLTVSYAETWEYVADLIDRFILAAPLQHRTIEVRDFDSELAQVERDLAELNAALDAKEITYRIAGVREKELLEKERKIKLAREKVRAGVKSVVNFAVAAGWRKFPYTEMREVIFGVFKHIAVSPGLQGWGPWDGRRFTPYFTEEMSPALNDMLVGREPGWDAVAQWLRQMRDDPDAPKDNAGGLALSEDLVGFLLHWARQVPERDVFRTPSWSQWILHARERLLESDGAPMFLDRPVIFKVGGQVVTTEIPNP